MKEYNVKCPICGMVNKHLYLEDTDGYMECENCYSIIKTDYPNLLSTAKENSDRINICTWYNKLQSFSPIEGQNYLPQNT